MLRVAGSGPRRLPTRRTRRRNTVGSRVRSVSNVTRSRGRSAASSAASSRACSHRRRPQSANHATVNDRRCARRSRLSIAVDGSSGRGGRVASSCSHVERNVSRDRSAIASASLDGSRAVFVDDGNVDDEPCALAPTARRGRRSRRPRSRRGGSARRSHRGRGTRRAARPSTPPMRSRRHG